MKLQMFSSIFVEVDDKDDGEVNSDGIHPDISIKGIDFKNLLKIFGNDLDND